jgi:hypothetical protein
MLTDAGVVEIADEEVYPTQRETRGFDSIATPEVTSTSVVNWNGRNMGSDQR